MYQTGNTVFVAFQNTVKRNGNKKERNGKKRNGNMSYMAILLNTVGVFDISTLSKLKLRREPQNNYNN